MDIGKNLTDEKFITCKKCGKLMDRNNYYTYRDGAKPELCKKCMTMHVDAFDTNTFLWLLEAFDVPYIEAEWNKLRNEKYEKDPMKFTSSAVFGKYMSKMKLVQFKNLRWEDTERLAGEALAAKEKQDEAVKEFDKEIQEKFERGEISEAEYKTLTYTEDLFDNADLLINPNAATNTMFYGDGDFLKEEDLPDPAADLTHEDKIYLAMKWGRLFKPDEWVALEKKYDEMSKSFTIDDSDTVGSLILVCKTYLKMNQALDCGDIDGYTKLSRAYESLRKSAKFMAVQKEQKEANFVDCIGEMVAYCEEKGGKIPRWDISTPQDIVDTIILDLKEYNKSLIYEDKSLAAQIEMYLKQKQNLEEQKKNKDSEIEQEDYEEYFDMINQAKEDNEEYFKEIEAGRRVKAEDGIS